MKKGNYFILFDFVNITDKQHAVIECLEEDLEMSTKKVIDKIREKYYNTITVSRRQIQRIRKDIRMKLKSERKRKMKEDVFNTESQNIPGARQWEVDLIVTVNSDTGKWSIQELSESFGMSEEAIRETVRKFDAYIKNEITDNEGVNTQTTTESEEESAGVGLAALDGEIDEIMSGYGYNTVGFVNTVNARDDFWEVKIECVDSCGKMNASVDVFMHKEARIKANLFMKWAGAREWLAYLVGEKLEDGNYVVTDLYLPDQRTSSTLVDEVEADEYNHHGIVGVIHSHHEMGAGDENRPSFSGHDANFINGNHNLSLLAGRDRQAGGFKIVGIGRVSTPCGSLMRVKANVKAFKTNEDKETETALRKEFMEKTQTKVHQYRNTVVGGFHNKGVSGVTQHTGKKTYHFSGGGWPGNQFNQGGGKNQNH